MTRKIRFLALATLILIAQAAPITATDAPKVRVGEPEFDFGTVEQGEYAVHSFVIENVGTSALEIGRVDTSCGCTAAEPTTRTVEPGQTSEVRVTFNSAGRKGTQHKVVTVHTNDPASPEVRLVLSGKVGVTLELAPSRLTFKEMTPGEARKETVKIRNRGESDVVIRSVASENANLTLTDSAGAPLAFPLTIAKDQSLSLTASYSFPEGGRSFYYSRAEFEVEGRPTLVLRVSVRRGKTQK